jgi:dTDP-glucose 4,6-dehydratase
VKTYLVTGGAGFIGSNFIHYILKKYRDIKIINYDKLTYAGNLGNLESVSDNPNYTFVQGDICDRDKLNAVFEKYDIDYVVNFAAESHVDRSIKNPEIFVTTNVIGTVTLLNAAKHFWIEGNDFKVGKR